MPEPFDPDIEREFKQLCRLVLKFRRRPTVTVQDLTITTSDRGELLCICSSNYATVCDEITDLKFNYLAARRYMPALRQATLLDRLADA